MYPAVHVGEMSFDISLIRLSFSFELHYLLCHLFSSRIVSTLICQLFQSTFFFPFFCFIFDRDRRERKEQQGREGMTYSTGARLALNLAQLQVRIQPGLRDMLYQVRYHGTPPYNQHLAMYELFVHEPKMSHSCPGNI